MWGRSQRLGGHKQQRQTVRKIVWNSNSNLPIKDKIDENRGLSSPLCNKLRFQHNKQHTPPLNTALLTHLLWHNLWSAVNSHYTLALGKSSPHPLSQSALSEAWMIKQQLRGRKYGKQSCGWRELGCSSRGGRWGRQRIREGKWVTQHKNAQTARIPRNKNSQTKTEEEKYEKRCGRKSRRQGGGNRKKDGGWRQTQGEMRSVPWGAPSPNTEKEFYKQQ